MKNFRDVTATTSDIGAGFQFEFFCQRCNETWRSPFKPYRTGQLTGLLSRSSALTGELAGGSRACLAPSRTSIAPVAASAPSPMRARRKRGPRHWPKPSRWPRTVTTAAIHARTGLATNASTSAPAFASTASKAEGNNAAAARKEAWPARIVRRLPKAGVSATSAASTWPARTRVARRAAPHNPARPASAAIAGTASRRGHDPRADRYLLCSHV